jgi:hypothetical protein
LLLLIGAMTIAIVVLAFQLREEEGPLDAEAVAVDFVEDGVVQESRRDGDRWEVEVVRADGSMVQVNLGDNLELRSLDEELGPGGTLASDEVKGPRRVQAVRAAFREAGRGQVVSVERDSARRVKVRIQTKDGRYVGVVLDDRLQVVGVDPEDPDDE